MQRKFFNIVVITILSIYHYFFWEWLFNFLKPSFLNRLPIEKQLEVLFVAPFPVVVIALAIVVVLIGLAYIARATKLSSVCEVLSQLIPALFLAAIAFVMFDTSIYILFHTGIARSEGVFKILWLAGFIVGIYYFHRVVGRTNRYWSKHKTYLPRVLFYCSALLMMSVATVLWTVRLLEPSVPPSPLDDAPETAIIGRNPLPNILIFSGDALENSRLSAYGYERDTTPFIKSIVDKALVVDNSFPNGTDTLNSIPSLWSGKLPITEHVIYYPDIFRGRNSYQHFLGLLQSHGYYNIAVTTPYVVDPYHLNMRSSVDRANRRTWGDFDMPFTAVSKQINFENERMLLLLSATRVEERALHLLGQRNMYDHEAEIMRLENRHNSDEWRINEIKRNITSAPQPFFIHTHLMGTHGQKFFPRTRRFSSGMEQPTSWIDEFYDDAVLDFDSYFKEVYQALEKSGKLANTLVIVISDHDKERVIERTPLLMWFPHHEYRGRVLENVQQLDIDATILEYLGIPKPSWLHGESFLEGKISPDRTIFITSGVNEFGRTPPFYNLGSVSAIVCDQAFKLDLLTNTLTVKTILNNLSPCNRDLIPSQQKARERIVNKLQSCGYDISSLQLP